MDSSRMLLNSGSERPKRTILVVEDDHRTATAICLYMERAGFLAEWAPDGAKAWTEFCRISPLLVILDLMLPICDGVELCRSIRAVSSVPIIMVTARSSEADGIAGLGAGADDYVIKPFSPRLLVARVQALLRRSSSDSTITVGPLTLDPAGRCATLDGRQLRLTRAELGILTAMARRPDFVLNRYELLSAAGAGAESSERVVDVHVTSLRRKLAGCPTSPRIEAMYGVGYRMVK